VEVARSTGRNSRASPPDAGYGDQPVIPGPKPLATRWEGLPDIPTVGELVPGYDGSGWYGIGAPDSGHARDCNDMV
jgi:hypothetical protein